MLVKLSLLAGVLAASTSVSAANQVHGIRSGRPHAGRAVGPAPCAEVRADAAAAANGQLAARGLTRRVVRSSACAAASSSRSLTGPPAPTASTADLSSAQAASSAAPSSSSAGQPRASSAAAPSVEASAFTSAIASDSTSAASQTAPSAAAVATSAPAANGEKLVAVHHMVGNTYSYTQGMWAADIALAAASGIDAFALNLGTDFWQASQVASAYAAAQAYGPSFKLFLSLDMTIFPCGSAGDAATLVALTAAYANHPNQATYQNTGRPIVSTFAGSDCTFGTGDWNTGWQQTVKTPFLAQTGKDFFFLPSVFADPSTFSSATVMDGELNWNGGWPTGSNAGATWWSDDRYLSALGDKAYMATVSPTFFTHYGANSWNKNWIFQSDDFLFAARWKTLVDNRHRFDSVEVLTWNDFGESSYIGPIQGDQPNSQAWVDGFDHTALLAINKYYATAFKTGSYPAITKDVIYLSARPHAKTATASADSVGRPTGGQNGDPLGYLWTDDEFFALVFATKAGEVTLASGSNTKTVPVTAGVNWLSQTLQVGAGMTATFNGVSCSPEFTFTDTPMTYNWNYLFASSS